MLAYFSRLLLLKKSNFKSARDQRKNTTETFNTTGTVLLSNCIKEALITFRSELCDNFDQVNVYISCLSVRLSRRRSEIDYSFKDARSVT